MYLSNETGIDGENKKAIRLFLAVAVQCIPHIINSWNMKSYILQISTKNKNPTEFKQLRSINIVSNMSKILEQLAKGHGSCTALVKFTDNINRSYENGKFTILTLLDFYIYLSIIHYIRVGKFAIELIFNNLSDRYQIINLNKKIQIFTS